MLPGYLSPSADLKLAEVPNGFAAICWGQALASTAFYDTSQNQSPGLAGFAAGGNFARRRQTETKHGPTGMLAAM
eukprot:4439792-Heterocapsa_arctica.AAC.1